jgi:His-Xaa-Ser system protein HxsD
MLLTALTVRWLDIDVGIELETTVDATIYDVETLHRAAYALTSRCAIRFERAGASHVRVIFRPLGSEALNSDIIATFENELIDYRVRADLSRETAVIRDLIFRQAFVEADL